MFTFVVNVITKITFTTNVNFECKDHLMIFAFEIKGADNRCNFN